MKLENLTKAAELADQLKRLREQHKTLTDPYARHNSVVDPRIYISVGDTECRLDKGRMITIVKTEIARVIDELKEIGIEGAERG